MSKSRSRSASVREDEEELRLPRPPGVIRRFWARHPLLADVLIAILCLLMTVTPAANLASTRPGSDDGATSPETAMVVSWMLAVIVFVACAMLLRRRRWPVAVFVVAHVVAVLQLLLVAPAGGPLLLVASYSLAVYRSSRAAWIGFGAGMTALTAVAVIMERIGHLTLQDAINATAGELTLGLIGTLIGVNVGGRKRYLEAVIDRSRQLLVERDQHARLAAAAERDRIAREMHDIVSHTLTVVVALSEGAAATDDQQRAREAASAAASTARGALTEMRAMLGVLRDGDTDAPLVPGEPVDPHATVSAAQRAGYPISLVVTGEPDVSPALAYAIGRIVQEGVTNAMRHAPAATSISVRIDHSTDPLIIQIDNDGVTSDAVGTSGFGLRGLSERAAHVSGSVQSGPVGAGRWRLRAELPARLPGHADAAASTDRTRDAR